jgi:hypothetical protein
MTDNKLPVSAAYPVRPSALLRGVQATTAEQATLPRPAPVAGNVVQLVARIGDGERGVSSIENVGPRLSHYVFVLRRSGVGVVTIDEKHGGPYAGEHARYRLSVPVELVTVEAKP